MSNTDGPPPGNPFVGPRPFQTGERLYGRDRERAELRDLLIAQRIVVMYAPSGAGKTSLIQAALVPELEETDFHVLPVIRVNQPIANGADGGTNRYVRSALLSLDSALPPSDQCDPDELAAMTLSDYVAARPRPTGPATSDVLIFDQFEEILTLDPTDIDEKRAFFDEVGQLLRNEERWALFSLREDHIAALDPFLPAIPTRLATPFRLDLLGPDAARLAMQQPALNAGSSFTDDAAQRLVDDLRRIRLQQPDGSTQERLGPYIEPVQLQVVCQRLWEHLGESGGRIDSQLVDTYGDVDGALRAYYADSVKAVAAETGVPERRIRAWFDEELITEHGVRGQVLWEPEQSAGLDDRVIDRLVDRHLVRRESRRGALWFELAHDRLIAPIQLDNDAWYQVNLSALQQQAALWHSQGKVSGYLLTGEALEQAEQWAAAHPSVLTEVDQAFLTDSQEQRTLQAAERREQELVTAQRIAEEAQARQQAEEAARLEAEHRVADQIQATRRSRVLTGAAVAAALVAVVFLLLARDRAAEADEQRAFAEIEATRAHQEANRANALLRMGQARDESDPRAGLLLSIEALNTDATIEAKRTLLESVLRVPNASRIWPEPVAELDAGEGEIRAVALSANSEKLITGDETGKVTLWRLSEPDSSTEVSVAAIGSAGDGALRSVGFAPNNLSIAVAGDGGVRLLDPSSLEERRIISEKPATSVAYTTKGEALVYGNADGSVSRLNIASSQTNLNDLSAVGGGPITTIAVSAPGWVAAGRDDGTVLLWNAAGGVVRLPASTPDDGTAVVDQDRASINSLTFDRQGTRLAAGDDQGRIRQWDLDLSLQSATARDPLRQGEDALIGLAYSADGTTLTAADHGGRVILWGIQNNERIKEDALTPGTWSVAFASGGPPQASGGDNGTVYLWSQVWTVFNSAEPLTLDAEVLSAVAVSPDGEHLLVGGHDGTVQRCDRVEAPLSCGEIATDLGNITSLALSHSGQLLASGDDTGIIVLESLEGNQEVHSLEAGSPVTGLAFSADDQQLLAGVEILPGDGEVTSSGKILVWDLSALPESPTEMPTTASGLSSVVSLDASPIGVISSLAVDRVGQRMAIAGTGGITWNGSADRSVLLDRVGALKTRSVAFSPDGSQIASGRSDGWVYLWQTDSLGAHTSTGLGRLQSPVIALGWFNADTVIAVSADGLVAEFSLDPTFMKTKACELAGRDFSPEESQRLFGNEEHRACS